MITKPKGTKDLYSTEAKRWQYVSKVIDEIMEKYNYSYIRVPVFESSELFHRGVGESSDIVTKETYDFIDRGDRKMTLRPEGTAGVVRSYIENKMYGNDNKITKLYYNMPMYRYERPQKGRLREFTQFGYEILGSFDAISDAEVISIAVNFYKLLGLKGIKVNINSLGDNDSRNNYKNALVDYFKPYINELCSDCCKRLEVNPLRILDCKIDCNLEIFKNAPKITDYLTKESKERFEKVKEYLSLMGINYEENSTIVRGLDYYNHTVFEIEAEIEGFGSQNVIGAGGRYNNLVKELGGPVIPGVGFACGLDRLMLALDMENINIPVNDAVDLYIGYINDDEKKCAIYLLNELRMSGFIAETNYNDMNVKAIFKQADRLNSKFTIILNSEDLKFNELKIKNNKTKKEDIVSLDKLISYLDDNLSEECNCGEDCNCSLEHEHCNCHNK